MVNLNNSSIFLLKFMTVEISVIGEEANTNMINFLIFGYFVSDKLSIELVYIAR